MKHVSLRTFDSDGIIFSLCAGRFHEFLSGIFIRMQKRSCGLRLWILIFVVVHWIKD